MEIMEINKFTLFHFWGVNYVNYIVINIMNKFKFAKIIWILFLCLSNH